MSKWIDFSIDERRAMIQAVSQAKQIDEASAEKRLMGYCCSLCHVPYQHQRIPVVQRRYKP